MKKEMTSRKMNMVVEEVKALGIDCKRQLVHKNNKDEEALVLCDAKFGNAKPNVYFCDFDASKTAKEIAKDIVKRIDNVPVVNIDVDDIFKLENVFGTIINAELNADYLETVVHRDIEDLAIVYRLKVNSISDIDNVASTVVTNQVMERMGVREEDLYNAAIKNLEEPLVTPMFDMLMGIDNGISLSEIDRDKLEENPMYVLTNKEKWNGAFCMVCTDVLDRLCDLYGDDIYIIPSSIHEVIVIPQNDSDVDGLTEMIQDINRSVVDQREVLSNHPYSYSKGGKIEEAI